MSKLKIVYVDIKDLKPAEYNPREMDDKESSNLEESLERFGMVEPIVVNSNEKRKNIIIGGHQRFYTEKKRGVKQMPVVYIDIEDIEKERELNLRLNKNLGHWDYNKLSDFDEDLLSGVGFTEEELEGIYDLNLDEVEEDEFDGELPEKPVSKLGESYQLGRHRLVCGDATKIEDVEKLMDGKKADMVFTDPPYGMDLDTDYSGMKGWHKGKKYDLVIGDDKPFDIRWFDWIDCKEQFWWGADYYVETLPNFGKDGSWMVWDKRVDESKDKMFGSGFEMLWSKQRHQRRLIRQMWAGFMGDAEASKRVHPTQKPSKLAIKIISEYGKDGDIVLDLFGGSGSTLIACEQSDRTCYMMELDPKYCDVIRKRYAKFIKQEDWKSVTPLVE